MTTAKKKEKHLDVRSVNKCAGLTSMISPEKRGRGKKLHQTTRAIPSRKICTMMTTNAIANMAQSDFETPNWSSVEALSNEISAWILRTAEDINDSVNLVKAFGCKHVNEFNVVVEKTNEDLRTFMDDFEKVKEKHKGFSGDITSPDELTLCIQVFEDYTQFRAKFEGVMYHTLISFTEYSLEAKDLAVEQIQRKEATEELLDVEKQLDVVIADPMADVAEELTEQKEKEQA